MAFVCDGRCGGAEALEKERDEAWNERDCLREDRRRVNRGDVFWAVEAAKEIIAAKTQWGAKRIARRAIISGMLLGEEAARILEERKRRRREAKKVFK